MGAILMFADGLTNATPKTKYKRPRGRNSCAILTKFSGFVGRSMADHEFKFGGIITKHLRVIWVYPRGAFSSKIISSH